MSIKKWLCLVVMLAIAITFQTDKGLCSENREVVVYTALDQVYSEPILKEFEKKTNIRVKAIYDIEAAKTTGLVNRLIGEKKNPQCDVFWNNEVGRTILLKRKGVLSPYFSNSAKDIPALFKDSEGYWTGLAARARVLVVNTSLVKESSLPDSIFDLTKPEWKGKIAIANPLFGTTATHIAALFSIFGEQKAMAYLKALKQNDIQVVDGNSVVRDQVGAGDLLLGFTDTDDVNMGIFSGMPIKAIYPDKDGIGTLLIPNTVSLIKNSPNPEMGKKLIDYILSKKVEERLALCESVQMPLRDDIKTPKNFVKMNDIKTMNVDFEKIADIMEVATKYTQKLFIE